MHAANADISKQIKWFFGIIFIHSLNHGNCTNIKWSEHNFLFFNSIINYRLILNNHTVCRLYRHSHHTHTHIYISPLGYYSRPSDQLIPCTSIIMIGCQATRYRIQSRRFPYKMSGLSQLNQVKIKWMSIVWWVFLNAKGKVI